MGLYHQYVFPCLCDMIMANKPMTRERRLLLAEARGTVLEIGFGTGRNVPHYPKQPGAVDRLVTVDVNPGMSARAEQRLRQLTIPVEHKVVTAERLPLADASIDTVVTTWTLCSIPDPARALAEAFRVLKPGGQLLFVEHGLAPEPGVQAWQHRLTPLFRRLGDGCHLNRDVAALLQATPFRMERLDMFYLRATPRAFGHTFKGRAVKASA